MNSAAPPVADFITWRGVRQAADRSRRRRGRVTAIPVERDGVTV